MPATQKEEYQVVYPLVCTHETDKEVILEAEMPGLAKEDVNLEIKDEELTISGKRKVEEVPSGYQVVQRERRPVEYRRTFVVGSGIQNDKINAKYENGILKLTLPKSEKVQPKKIELR